jgi:phosphoglycerate dehydrogenase-like enzyme
MKDETSENENMKIVILGGTGLIGSKVANLLRAGGYSTGGNINGMIKAAEANLAMVTDKTVVVFGHGPVGGKTEMIEYRDMLVAIHDRVAAFKGEGQSLNEIVAAKPTAAYDAKWGGFVIDGNFFTRLIYDGV